MSTVTTFSFNSLEIFTSKPSFLISEKSLCVLHLDLRFCFFFVLLGGFCFVILFMLSTPAVISVRRVLLVTPLPGCWATLGIYFSFVCSLGLCFSHCGLLSGSISKAEGTGTASPGPSSRWVASPLPGLLTTPTQGRWPHSRTVSSSGTKEARCRHTGLPHPFPVIILRQEACSARLSLSAFLRPHPHPRPLCLLQIPGPDFPGTGRWAKLHREERQDAFKLSRSPCSPSLRTS